MGNTCFIWQASNIASALVCCMHMQPHNRECVRMYMTDVYSFILVCVRIPRNERAICPKEAQKGRTCRRSAENINVMWISENRERKEMKQRTEVLTPPPDIVISSFSHQTEEEENNAQHIRSLGELTGSSSVYSLRKDKKGKKNQRAERWGQAGTE